MRKSIHKYALTYVICLCFFAVNANTDSLIHALKLAKPDSNRANTLLELTKYTVYDNQVLAKKYCLEGLTLSHKIGWRNHYIFYAHLATIYQLNNMHDSAVYYNKLNYAGAIKAQNIVNQAIALNNIASACIYANKLDEAYAFAEKAVVANSSANNKLGLAISKQIIGTIENDYGNYEKAILYLKQSRANFIEAGDKLYASSILINIGDIYLNSDKTDSAIYVLNKSRLEIGNLADSYFYESYYEQIGRYYMKLAKPKLALENFNLAFKHAYEAGSTTHQIGLNLQKANALNALNLNNQALAIAEPNIAPAIEGHLYDVVKNCALLVSTIYEQKGKHQLSLKYYKIHKQYSDSILNADKNKQIAMMSVRFNTIEKEQENLNLINESNNKGRLIKLIVAISILTVLFILSITIIFIYNQNKTKRMNKELTSLNHTKDKLFGMISHDLRGPLSTTEMMAFLISKKTLEPNEVKRYAIELGLLASRTNSMLDNMLNWAYSQLNGIKINKQQVCCYEVIQECVELLAAQIEKKELTIINDVKINSVIIADTDILRFVFRNLLSNAIKFSEHGQLIKMSFDNEQNYFKIIDFGVGIAPDKIRQINNVNDLLPLISDKGTLQEKGAGLGIMLIKTFLKAHGGYLKAMSNGNETCVQFWL